MERRITEKRAEELYNDLLNVFSEDVSLKCKQFLLRQQLERIVYLVAKASPGSDKVFTGNPRNINFPVQMDLIFDTVEKTRDARRLKKDIISTKNCLNDAVHHVSIRAGEDMKKHLRRVLDLIYFFSGVPVPNKLHDASRTLERVEIRRALDVIILNEMFDSTDEVGSGATICNQLLSMMREKDELGFGSVNFYLINYMPSVLCRSTVNDDERSLGDNGINVALDKTLMLLKERIKKYKKRDPGEAFKPMFLWICNSLSKELDKAKMQELVALSKGEDGDNYTFYPIVTSDKGVEQFRGYDDKWRAKVLIPQLIENFTFSLLLSIQRADAKQ
ncbi:MAG: hypothetical protein J6Q33_02650 [Alistipes sp.]|nr:hypothetical protein [Alistipes sp.]